MDSIELGIDPPTTDAPSLDGLEVVELEIEHATCADTLIAGEIELVEPAND